MDKALSHLQKDPVMKKLIETYDLPTWVDSNDIFLDIIETIINQQLSSKAGTTIFNRFKALFNNQKITPQKVLLADQDLRSSGISNAKVQYIKNVAKAIQDKELEIVKFAELSDAEVIAQLIEIKGIGKWTAEMILMFSLKRPDIFSMGDLGLCAAVAKLYNIDRKDLKKIEQISLKWSPYRSIACRYLWRSLETSQKIL